jgi:hypothetical protein
MGEASREQEQTAARVRVYEATGQYQLMLQIIGNVTKAELTRRANEIAEKAGDIPKPDRLAQRHKPALICWFCQYCSHWIAAMPQPDTEPQRGAFWFSDPDDSLDQFNDTDFESGSPW